jgi:hypothetical protein
MMQNLLNVMPDLKHSVETLPQKKDQDPGHSTIITSHVLTVNGAWPN